MKACNATLDTISLLLVLGVCFLLNASLATPMITTDKVAIISNIMIRE